MTQERRTFGAAVKAKAALATAQAAFNQHRGRGRGGFEPWGTVAVNLNSGNARLVLLLARFSGWTRGFLPTILQSEPWCRSG